MAKDTPVPQAPTNPGGDPGTVKISHYESKHLILDADAKTPAVLLLNDRMDDAWNVWIEFWLRLGSNLLGYLTLVLPAFLLVRYYKNRPDSLSGFDSYF